MVKQQKFFDARFDGDINTEERRAVTPIVFLKRLDQVKKGVENKDIGILVKAVVYFFLLK